MVLTVCLLIFPVVKASNIVQSKDMELCVPSIKRVLKMSITKGLYVENDEHFGQFFL